MCIEQQRHSPDFWQFASVVPIIDTDVPCPLTSIPLALWLLIRQLATEQPGASTTTPAFVERMVTSFKVVDSASAPTTTPLARLRKPFESFVLGDLMFRIGPFTSSPCRSTCRVNGLAGGGVRC